MRGGHERHVAEIPLVDVADHIQCTAKGKNHPIGKASGWARSQALVFPCFVSGAPSLWGLQIRASRRVFVSPGLSNMHRVSGADRRTVVVLEQAAKDKGCIRGSNLFDAQGVLYYAFQRWR